MRRIVLLLGLLGALAVPPAGCAIVPDPIPLADGRTSKDSYRAPSLDAAAHGDGPTLGLDSNNPPRDAGLDVGTTPAADAKRPDGTLDGTSVDGTPPAERGPATDRTPVEKGPAGTDH